MSITQLHPAADRTPRDSGGTARARLRELVAEIDGTRLDAAEALLAGILAHQRADTRAVTEAEIAALERFGVSEAELQQTTALPATASGMLSNRTLSERSVTVAEAAVLLGVTPARVRQRCAAGTLLAHRRSDGWHLPRFQFPEDRELRGWPVVAREIPPGTPWLFVERVLTSPAPALISEGVELAPFEWMMQGGDPAAAAQAVDDALHRLP